MKDHFEATITGVHVPEINSVVENYEAELEEAFESALDEFDEYRHGNVDVELVRDDE